MYLSVITTANFDFLAATHSSFVVKKRPAELCENKKCNALRIGCFFLLHEKSIDQNILDTVTGATDCGLLEGVLRGQGTGLFPAHCVQEVRLRHTNIPLGPQIVREGRNRVLGRRESQHKYFATAPRLKKP